MAPTPDQDPPRPSALPMCAQPPPPPPLPEGSTVSPPTPALAPTFAEPVAAPPAKSRLRLPFQRSEGTTSGETPPPVAAERPRGSTSTEAVRSWRRRWAPGGEPDDVKDLIGYSILIVIGLAGMALRGHGRTLRKPDDRQLEDIAAPLAQIACRRLPMHLLGPDALDATRAAKATENYMMAGPLVIPSITSGMTEEE